MSTVSKAALTGNTSGRGIKVVATATPGTVIHTAITTGSTVGNYDEVWLWAYCVGVSPPPQLTIQFGGTTAPDDYLGPTSISTQAGWTLICPGLILNGGLIVRAFVSTTNTAIINGFVNVITA